MVVSRIRTEAIALTLALTLVASAASAAGLDARVGHTVVREGEEVQLLLRAPTDASVAAPDLSPLEKDFHVLGTQQSQRISIMNGRREASIDWTVTLLPRATGEVVVPAIQAGSLSSAPVRLRVTEAGPPPGRADAPDLFVESSVDESSPYVQGEVRYSVKVYDGIGIRGGGLSEPRAENARVTPIGEGRTYQERVNGRLYQVHEREYSVSPQSSGTMTIAPVTLEARIDDPNARRRSPFGDFFGGRDPFGDMLGRSGFGSSLFDDFFNRGRPVRVHSNSVEIDVQARPDGAAEGWFLPAKHVELRETFTPVAPEFRVGEAVKRTVTLHALGASAEQLPSFVIPAANGIRQYDEGSRDGTVPTDDGTVSVREQTVALVPSAAGTIELPAVEVEWWDAQAETKRVASLPARTIEVLPAVGEIVSPPVQATVPATASASAPQVSSGGFGDGSGPVEVAGAASEAEWYDEWLPVLALLAVMLAAGGGYVLARKRPGPSSSSPDALGASDLVREVERACKTGDAASTRDALIRWARAEYGVGAPANPRMIAKKLGHPEMEAEAAKLDRSLYAPGADPFDGRAFWKEFRVARSQARKERGAPSEAVLPELYPST